VSGLPLTYLAAHVATHTASTPLRRAFAVFMLAIAVYYLWQAFAARRRAEPPQTHPERWPIALAIGATGGAMSGMFSTGGAIFAVPLLSAIFGVSQAAAQGLGLALVGPGTFVSLGTYAAAGDVVWSTGIPLAIGGIVAIGWGVHLAHRLPERALRTLFSIMAAYSSVALWLRA
jgi:uncharacterized membrane protein YfcA